MALYPRAIQKPIPPGPNDPPIRARLAILHVAASEGPSLFPYFNGPSGGVESHFYVRYDGTVEQYRDTDFQADANTDANPWAVSIETEGLELGTWTDAQLASIKALLQWLHEVEQIPMSVPKTWDGSGMGFHTLFPDRWDKRGASCPGPNRKKQFYTELVPWMAAGGNEDDDMYSDEDRKRDEATHDRVFGMLNQRYFAPAPDQPGVVVSVAEGKGSPTRALDTLDGNYLVQRQVRLEAKVDGLTAALKAIAGQGSSFDLAAVVKAVDEAVDAAFDERVESSKIVLDVTTPAS